MNAPVRPRSDEILRVAAYLLELLASESDLTAVLNSITNRCRRLLGSDVAYLSLVDHSATETYVRVTDGTISHLMANLRLPIDVGIGGVVVRSGLPHQCRDYFLDPSIAHTAVVDEAIRAEKLKGILGVPMKVSGRLIGIVFAADRVERVFSAEEVELLSSLATLAALAIERAKLLDQTQRALADVEVAHSKALEQQVALDRAAAAHELFTQVILGGGGLDGLMAAIFDVLEVPAVIVEPGGAVLASIGVPEGQDLPKTRLDEVSDGREGDWVLVPVDAVSDSLGTLLLLHPEPLSNVNRRIAERAAMVAAVLLYWSRTRTEESARDRSAFLTDVLSNTRTGRTFVTPRGLPSHGEWRVCAVGTDVPDHRLLSAITRLVGARDVLHVRYADELVVAFPVAGEVPSAADLAPDLAHELASAVLIGGAESTRGIDGLREAYDQASFCLRALRALGVSTAGAGNADLGIVGLILSDSRDMRQFVRTQLGVVLDYDSRRNAALLRTMDTYFKTNRSIQETADRLRVHPNTVTQRLERISSLVGPAWRDSYHALNLQLALSIHSVMQDIDRR